MEIFQKCILMSTFNRNIGVVLAFPILLGMITICTTQNVSKSRIDLMEETTYSWLPEDTLNKTSPEDDLFLSYTDIRGMQDGNIRVTYVTIGNLKVPICLEQHVCHARTCSISNVRNPVCHCDDLCTFFGDCCPKSIDTIGDRLADCNESQTVNQSHLDSYDKGFFSCEGVKNSAQGTNTYVFISKCPSTWNDNHIRERCEVPYRLLNFSLEDIPLSFESTISYRNIYCAVCNGLNPQRLTPWLVDLICPEEMVEDLKINPQPFEEILHNEQCWLSVNYPVKASGPAVRPCFKLKSSETPMDSCPPSCDPQLQEACKSMTAPIILFEDNDLVGFKNPACYACTFGSFPDPKNMCPDYGNAHYSYVTNDDMADLNASPISVLFDISSKSDIRLQVGQTVVSKATVACHSEEVFDPYSGSCMRLTCPQGFKMSGSKCARELSEDESMCNWLRRDFNETISLTVVSKDDGLCADYGEDQRCDVYELVAALKLTSLTECKEKPSGDQYETLFIWGLERNDTVTDAVMFEYGGINMTNRSCSFSTLSIFSSCSAANTCDNRMVKSSNTFEITTSSLTHFSNEPNPSSHNDDKTRDKFIVLKNTYQLLDKGHDYVKIESRFACQFSESTLACPSAIFNISLFIPFGDDGNLKYEPSGDIISPDEYVLLKDGMLRACQFLSQNGTVNKTTTNYFLRYSPTQTYLSFAGTALSLASLLLTLLTYIVFPSLRKQVSNHLIMTLCGALIIAQCLLLFGGMVSKVSRHLCAVFAVGSHFSWLTVFTVSSMIALDLSRTFGSHGTIRISTANRKLLVGYLSVATGVPFLIVSITLSLSIVIGEDIDLHYGDQLSCWVGDGRANLFVFGVPVLSLLCLNLFLFVKTIRGIARSKKIGMTLHEGKKVSSYTQELLKIAIKVSSIMGFTWVFGFVAAFSKQEALWFIFIVLNASQGVYIFLAFAATRRVFYLWRDLLLKKLYDRRSNVRSDMRLRAKSEPSSVQTISV